ncbi:hypothetical protein C1H76_6362 [Elsinoe australis]|uniref:Uncharacterized protein n=1 Tax=Elsinoe australis TaxID=40998 RepID=A0A4U7ASK4_9PEZI|nr:hypothetical protein C1H76_6362 [Elsinoe australis]
MGFKTGLLIFPLAVIAAPQLKAAEEIHVVWSYQRATNITAMKAVSSDFSIVLGETKSNTLNTGDFATAPISMDVDKNGFGSLKHGDVIYKIHSDRQHSGGISCATMWDSETLFIDCSVPWTAPSTETRLHARAVDNIDLRAAMGVEGFPAFMSAAHVKRSSPAPVPTRRQVDPLARNSTSDSLDKRQCEPWPVQRTVLQGDGNPHQNYYHRQTSEPLECGNGPCEVSFQVQKTFTIGFTANIDPFGWINGGFAVESSTTSGNAYNCGGGPGDLVCSWYNMGHTAYTVDNWTTDDVCMNNERIESTSIIKSPNQRNIGGRHYCVRGPCRSIDDAYWDDTGRAGGP